MTDVMLRMTNDYGKFGMLRWLGAALSGMGGVWMGLPCLHKLPTQAWLLGSGMDSSLRQYLIVNAFEQTRLADMGHEGFWTAYAGRR